MSSDKSHISVGIDDDSIRFSLSPSVCFFVWFMSASNWYNPLDLLPFDLIFLLCIARRSSFWSPFPSALTGYKSIFLFIVVALSKITAISSIMSLNTEYEIKYCSPEKKIASKCFSASILDKIKKKQRASMLRFGRARISALLFLWISQSDCKCAFLGAVPFLFSLLTILIFSFNFNDFKKDTQHTGHTFYELV